MRQAVTVGLAAGRGQSYNCTSLKRLAMPPLHSGTAGFFRILLTPTLLGLGCAFPSDQSDGVFIVVDAPAQVIEARQLLLLTARVYHRSGADSVEIPAVSLKWTSSRTAVATVTPRSANTAVVTGVSPGATAIRVAALDYDRVPIPVLRVRVAASIAIDSVRPDTAVYGSQITLFGHGLGEVEQAVLGGGALLPDLSTFIEEPGGLGRLNLWVPYPASSGRVVLVSTAGSSTASRSTVEVLPLDLYDTLAAPVPGFTLDGPPLRGADTLLFNPALALVSSESRDDYRLVRSDTDRPITIVTATLGRTVEAFDPVLASGELSDQQFGGSPADFETWAVGLGGQYCHGTFIRLPRPVSRGAPVEVVRAYQRFPAPELHLSVFGEGAGRYSITIRDAYVLSDPRIQADRFEDNEDCIAADAIASDPARLIDLSTPFADTLTIDNPFEPDWFSFQVPTGPVPFEPRLVNIQVAPRPFAGADSSDIGLVVVIPPFSGVVAESHQSGSYESLTVELFSGQYYLLVVDEGGAATRYSLCLAVGSFCTLPTE